MTEDNDQEKKVPCDVYSRVVGYIRPLANWSDAKRQEFEDRRVYAVPTKEELDGRDVGLSAGHQ